MRKQGTLTGEEAGQTATRERSTNLVLEKQSSIFSQDFRTALDNNREYIYIIEPETHQIIYSNKAFQKFFGESKEGLLCYEELQGKKKPCTSCPAIQLRDEDFGKAVEMRLPDDVWLLAQASSLNWKGKALMLVTCTDITEQKQAEEMLRIRNEEYRIVVAQSGKQVLRYNIKTKSMDRCFEQKKHFSHFEDAMIKRGLIAEECLEEYRAFFQRIQNGEPSGSADIRIASADGQFRWHHADYTTIFESDGTPSHAIISYYDNTEQYEKELAYRQWQMKLDSLLTGNTIYREINLSRGIIERAENLKCPDVGTAGSSFSDYVRSGRECMVPPEDAPTFREFFDRERLLGLYCAGVSEDQTEYRTSINGKLCWYRADLQMVKYPFSDEIKAFVIYTCIDKQRKALEKLTEAASKDMLTGLLNKGTTETKIRDALANRKAGAQCALFMIDMDNFKQINDHLGHMRGDQILRQAAVILANAFRKTDLVGRVGGDEFMAFMQSGASLDTTQKKAASLVASLRLLTEPVAVTASVGVVLIHPEDDVADFDTLYHMADQALYVNKGIGKNQYHIIGFSGETLSSGSQE